MLYSFTLTVLMIRSTLKNINLVSKMGLNKSPV